jgi:hypothetical protein
MALVIIIKRAMLKLCGVNIVSPSTASALSGDPLLMREISGWGL